jgi:ATP-binding cassette, subfamily C, bacterial LapB
LTEKNETKQGSTPKSALSNQVPPKSTPPKPPSKPTKKVDVLLLCLETLSELLEKPFSASAFKAGLPTQGVFLTPDLVLRASARAGFSSKIVKKNLEEILTTMMPCICLLEDNQACVLVGKKNQTTYLVIFPEYGKGIQEVKQTDFEKIYTGQALFMRPAFRFDTRWKEHHKIYGKHWFWGAFQLFRGLYLQAIMASVLINLFTIATVLFSLNVYDRVIPNNAFETLFVLSVGIFLIYIFDFVIKMLRGYFLDVAGKNSDILISSRLFEHVLNLKMASKPISSGGFLNTLKEFEGLRDFFSSSTLIALVDLPFSLLFLGAIFWIGGELGWIPVIGTVLVLIWSFFSQPGLQLMANRSFREIMQKQGILVEAIQGLETIKTLNAEGKFQKLWEDVVSRSSESATKLNFYTTLNMNFTLFVQNIAYVSIIIYGAFLVSEGHLSMGGIIACSILLSRSMMPLAQVVSILARFNHVSITLKELNHIIALPVERPPDKHFIHRNVFQGGIEFNNVTFEYPNQKTPALQAISFKIKPHEKVGLIGRVGSGKTTVEKLIMALYEPNSGSVLLDGVDTRQLGPSDIRANVGYVPQDIFHFFGSVKDNIRMAAQGVNDEALVQASFLSGTHEFVNSNPMGYDMQVGEGGGFLSGGQRQSIAIARALAGDAPILIMDEPTAMMDPASEAIFLKNMEKIIPEKTLVMITHRINLLSLVDRVLVFDQGKLIADGPRDEIIEKLQQMKALPAQEEPTHVSKK